MALKNLQALVLRAGLKAGARATVRAGKGFVGAMRGNPANSFSLPRHARPYQPTMHGDPEPVEHVDSVDVSSASRDVRAGRSEGLALAGSTGFARLARRTALITRHGTGERTLAAIRWRQRLSGRGHQARCA